MNARECMQALLDGKVLRGECNTYKLIDGKLMSRWNSKDKWHPVPWTINNTSMELVEEYPLTFEEALKEMLSGKKVENECSFEHYKFFDGTFKYYNYDLDIGWDEVELSPVIQKMKWKVVE